MLCLQHSPGLEHLSHILAYWICPHALQASYVLHVGSASHLTWQSFVYSYNRFLLLARHCLPPERTCADHAIDLMKTICSAHMPGIVTVVVYAASHGMKAEQISLVLRDLVYNILCDLVYSIK